MIEQRLQDIFVNLVKGSGYKNEGFDISDLIAKNVAQESDANNPNVLRETVDYYFGGGWQIRETKEWKIEHTGFPTVQYSYSIKGAPIEGRPSIKYIEGRVEYELNVNPESMAKNEVGVCSSI